MNKLQTSKDNSALYSFLESNAEATVPWQPAMLVNNVRSIPIQATSFGVGAYNNIGTNTAQLVFPVSSLGYLKDATLEVHFAFVQAAYGGSGFLFYRTRIEDLITGLFKSVQFEANGGRQLLFMDAFPWVVELWRERNKYSNFLEDTQDGSITCNAEGTDAGPQSVYARSAGLTAYIPIPFGFLTQLRNSFDFSNVRDANIILTMNNDPGLQACITCVRADNGTDIERWTRFIDGTNSLDPSDRMTLSIKMHYSFSLPNTKEQERLMLVNNAYGANGQPHLIGSYSDSGYDRIVGIKDSPTSFLNTDTFPWGALTVIPDIVIPIKIKNSVRAITIFFNTLVPETDIGVADRYSSTWGPEPLAVPYISVPGATVPFERMINTVRLNASGADILITNQSLIAGQTSTQVSGYARLENNFLTLQFYEDGAKAEDYGQVLPTTNLSNPQLIITPNPLWPGWAYLQNKTVISVVYQTQIIMNYSEATRTFTTNNLA